MKTGPHSVISSCQARATEDWLTLLVTRDEEPGVRVDREKRREFPSFLPTKQAHCVGKEEPHTSLCSDVWSRNEESVDITV